MKLHLTHKNMMDKGDHGGTSKEARAVEHQFRRDLDEFRAMCSLSAQTAAAKLYSGRIVTAMRHFGMEDDPLVRQMERIMGRHALRRPSTCRRNLFFKGVDARPDAMSETKSASVIESALPTELVGISATPESELPREVVRVPPKHRGHWVLRDPDLALTREGRRYDAW
jgi:hypothetical protein